jgi:hypothetical protein
LRADAERLEIASHRWHLSHALPSNARVQRTGR